LKVHEAIVSSGWDTLLLGVPFIALLFCGFFRLDQIIAAQRQPGERPRPVMGGLDEDGEPLLRDPDGRPSGKPRARSRPAAAD
jgi:hypothetical protein